MKTIKIELEEDLYNQFKIAGDGSAEKSINQLFENQLRTMVIEVKNETDKPMRNVDIFEKGKSIDHNRTIEQICNEMKNGNKFFFNRLRIECIDAPTEQERESACGSLIKIGERKVYPLISCVQQVRWLRDVDLNCQENGHNVVPIINEYNEKNRFIVGEIKPNTTMRYIFFAKYDFKISVEEKSELDEFLGEAQALFQLMEEKEQEQPKKNIFQRIFKR